MSPVHKKARHASTASVPATTGINTTNKKSVTLIQQLADPIDHTVRDTAFQRIVTWLVHSDNSYTILDVSKIWRALYYMYWHADGFQLQRELAEKIADIQNQYTVDDNGFKRCTMYLSAALTILHTEWPLVDRLRLDKFMYLIRCILNTSFNVLQKHNYNTDYINQLLGIYKDSILCVSPIKSVRGLQLYCVDIYLTELNKVLQQSDDITPTSEQIICMLHPVIDMLLVKQQDRTVLQRIIGEFITPLCDTTEQSQYKLIIQCLQHNHATFGKHIESALSAIKYSTDQRHCLLNIIDQLNTGEEQ